MRKDGRCSVNSLYPTREASTESMSDLYNGRAMVYSCVVFHLYSSVCLCLRSLNELCDSESCDAIDLPVRHNGLLTAVIAVKIHPPTIISRIKVYVSQNNTRTTNIII